jgi:hypothetical protein
MLDDFAGRPKFGAADASNDETNSRISLDTRTVRALLADSRFFFRLLVGHSKGNLVLSAALHDLSRQDEARAAKLAEGTKIVTIGTRIAMPPIFSDVIDVIGEWDWFGEMNSRPFIAADRRVPHAGHHTNTDLHSHLPVTSVLKEILAATPIAEEAQVASVLHVAAKSETPARRPVPIEKVKKAFSDKSLPNIPPKEASLSTESPPPKPH